MRIDDDVPDGLVLFLEDGPMQFVAFWVVGREIIPFVDYLINGEDGRSQIRNGVCEPDRSNQLFDNGIECE